MNFGAVGQAPGQGEGVGDRTFAQRPVFEREDAVTIGRGERRAHAGALAVGGIPQLAEAALGARHRAVQEDQQRPRAGGDRLGVGNGVQPEGADQVEAVEAGRVAAELLLLEGLAQLAGGGLDEIDAEEIEDADRQPGHAALAAARPPWR